MKFEDGVQPLPRRRDRRRRVPRVPPQPGHLRPAPGRPQPDAPGEDPLRQGRARPARDARRTSPRRTPGAGATSPPGRTRSSTSCSSSDTAEALRLLASVGLTSREACGDTVRNVAGCHLAGACPYEVLDISPWAEADQGPLPAQPDRAAHAAQVQDQLLRLRHRLRPGDVQRRRRDRGQPPASRRHRRARLPGVHGRRPRREPAPRASRSRSSPRARTSSPPSRRCSGCRTTTATATTSCGPA